MCSMVLRRYEISRGDAFYPDNKFSGLEKMPETLYVLGNCEALLSDGVAIIGSRKATPYGLERAREFAGIAACKGAVVFSGGARGIDAAAMEAALDEGGTVVAVLGHGLDVDWYPKDNVRLFERVLENGGALVSERFWSEPPVPFAFRNRNRIITALSKATLVCEAKVPSGTFSAADFSFEQGREVLVVPRRITDSESSGCNALLLHGATPVVSAEHFNAILDRLLGSARSGSRTL